MAQITAHSPELVVASDYDGYFERLVDSWIQCKRASGTAFKTTKVIVSAGPYRASAVSYGIKDGVITLDFYSALRNGFGQLSERDIAGIIDLL